MASDQQLFQRSGSSIGVSDLRKSYQKRQQTFHALNGISCELASGQVTVIQGPSGCGKTTFMNILGGVDEATSGIGKNGEFNVTQERNERNLALYRLKEVGFIFQSFNLIPGLTAIENLQLPMTVNNISSDDSVKRGYALLELVGMESKARKHPDELSGGEQQRIAIAVALANDPPLILADEPTGNLDSVNAERVTDLLCSLAHEFGKTVVIATHDSLVGSRGDQQLFMRDGVLENPHMT